MKKLIAVIFVLFSFQGLANNTINLTPIELCDQYLKGNSSLVLKKYKGKVIKDKGIVDVFFTDDGLYTKASFTLLIEKKTPNLELRLVGDILATPENDDEYTNLDKLEKNIFVKIGDINIENIFGDKVCTIYGELTNYE